MTSRHARRFLLPGLIMAMLFVGAPKAQASILTYDFVGTVSNVGGSIINATVGQALAFSFSMDSLGLSLVCPSGSSVIVGVNGTASTPTFSATFNSGGLERNAPGGNCFPGGSNTGVNIREFGAGMNLTGPAYPLIALLTPTPVNLAGTTVESILGTSLFSSLFELNVPGTQSYLRGTGYSRPYPPRVPEPASMAIFGLGLSWAAIHARRRIRRNQ